MELFRQRLRFFFRWGIHESASFQKAKRAISLADSEDFAAISDSQPTTSASPISSLSIMNISSATTDAWPRPVSSSTSHKLSQSSKKQAAVTKKTKCGLLPSTCSVRKISLHLKRSYNTLKRFYCVLIGTSLTWFLIDVTFYGTGSFKSEVVDEMFQLSASRRLGTFSGRSEGIYRQLEFPSSVRQLQRDVLREILGSFISINQPLRCQSNSTNIEPESRPSYVAAALRSLVVVDEGETRNKLFVEAIRGSIVACLAIPGYILSVLFIHKTGLRNLTFWGFWGVALAFFVLGGEQLLKLNIVVLELILFGLTFLATNFGPNSTTFILPTAVYPTAIRATCHGFSAAMGKLGGVVGTNLFGPVDNALGLAWLQILCGVIAVLGAVVTYFFIPSDEKAKESIELYDLDLALKSNRNREARLTRSTSHVISIKNFNS